MGSTTKRGYWFPAGNDAVSLFPGQNELLFMKKLDTDMDTALTANIAAARIPNLAASKITSGRFSDARIPSTVARTATVLAATEALSRRIDDLAALKDRIEELEDVIRGTGARSIINVIPDDTYDSGSFVVERTGNIVTLIAKSLLLTGEGFTYIGRLPVGFRPAASLTTIASTRTGGSGSPAQPMPLNLDASGGVGMAVNGNQAHISEAFVTSDSWPSSLPGDPA